MATYSKESQARIMIWSTPRSLSTTFARSMSARGDTMVFWEPYLNCYNCGPDRVNHMADLFPEMLNDKYTYSYIQGLLKDDFPDANVLFVKGMVEGITGHYDVVDRMYKHSFLIRHPRKMFRSFLKSFDKLKDILPPQRSEMISTTMGQIFITLEKFYHYVEIEMGQSSPPIIDADDLASQPERLLPKYCKAMGIEYTTRMLSWESVDPSQLDWQCIDVGPISYPSVPRDVLLGNAMKGQRFESPSSKDFTLPAFVEEIVEHNMPAYKRMYALRIQP